MAEELPPQTMTIPADLERYRPRQAVRDRPCVTCHRMQKCFAERLMCSAAAAWFEGGSPEAVRVLPRVDSNHDRWVAVMKRTDGKPQKRKLRPTRAGRCGLANLVR